MQGYHFRGPVYTPTQVSLKNLSDEISYEQHFLPKFAAFVISHERFLYNLFIISFINSLIRVGIR